MSESPQQVVLYGRISDDTEGRAAGVTRQIEDSTSLAQRLGWGLAPVPPFIDNDISASTRSSARRPAFEDMIARIERGEFDGIAYYSSSRLTRRPMEFEQIIQLVERTGIRLASVASGNADLTTADGRMIARILAAQDAAEAERTGERVKRAFAQRREQGKPNPSSRAFGFEAGGITMVPNEADLIQEAAQRIAHEGWSMGQVVKDWNERGVPTLRGAKAWRSTQVRRALLSPRAAGLIMDGDVIVGTFKSILTPELQGEVAQALQANRTGHGVTYQQRQHVLSGFLVCGRCNMPMKVNALRNEDGTLRSDSFVVCSRSQYGCGGVKRNLAVLTEFIQGAVNERLKTWKPVGEEEVQLEVISETERELAEVEEDVRALEVAFKGRLIRFKDYNTALSALRTHEEALRRTLEQRLAPSATPLDFEPVEAWANGSVEQRRRVLEELVDYIRLHPVGRVGPKRVRQMMEQTTEVVWITT